MKVRLTQANLSTIKPREKPYWITDAGFPNLRLYVGSAGKTWYACYRDDDGKNKSRKLGSAETLTVAQVRDMAKEFGVKVIRGEVEIKEKPAKKVCFNSLLEVYEPWVLANRRSGQETMNMIRSAFPQLINLSVDDVNLMEIEKWRMEKMNAGLKASSINRFISSLQAVLNWGVKRNLIETNHINRLERLREHDSDVKVRYLTEDERNRLMKALDAREKRIRDERSNHNRWLAERGRQLMPNINYKYADHIKPMVLISLHTGMRQGNLFALVWSDIDFVSNTVTLRAAASKAGKTLRLPINSVAVEVLKTWREQSAKTSPSALVFPSPVTRGMLSDVKTAWNAILKDAEIENFRWHDMRHDFASQLVMRGVDLNVVRELLGHSDMKMTMRYAHLAPSVKLQAVELLTKGF